MGLNKVILIGNVGRDPEVKTLESGTVMAKFSLATTNRRFKDEDGNPRTEWHNIVAWGKLAEIVASFVTKGMMINIVGEIRTRTYERDGEKKYFTEIHADDMEMLSRKGDNGGDNGSDDDEVGDQPY